MPNLPPTLDKAIDPAMELATLQLDRVRLREELKETHRLSLKTFDKETATLVKLAKERFRESLSHK